MLNGIGELKWIRQSLGFTPSLSDINVHDACMTYLADCLTVYTH